MNRLIWLLLLLLCSGQAMAQKVTLSGYVREEGSAELLPGVAVYVPALKIGVASNNYGFYSLTLDAGDYDLTFSFIGYQTAAKRVSLRESQSLDVALTPMANALQEVEIVAEHQEKISEEVQMSVASIPIEQLLDVPALLGEKDVLKTLQLMPGIQSGTEGSSGLYVRGGGPDQNLIILDDAPVYNAYHLFGFFSVFNGDALKSAAVYKGGFPARFGGRLSSVIKLDMKEGSKEKLHGKVGVGLISSSLMLEGPLKKNKSSFLISARRTYFDALMKPFMLSQGMNAGYYFYDLNMKANYEFSAKNKLYVSGYFGNDVFFSKEKYDDGDTYQAGLGWKNATGTLRWNHLFNPRLFANTSLIFSHYNFYVQMEERSRDEKFSLLYKSGITDFTMKTDFDYLPTPQHAIKAGLQFTYHQFTPYAFIIKESGFDDNGSQDNLPSKEAGVYVEDEFRPNDRFTLLGGFRMSLFQQDKKTYTKPEPRLALAYQLRKNLSAKLAYSSMNQYVHLLSNSGLGLPTDLWVCSTDRIAPQSSWQIAAGLAKDFPSKNFSLSVEAYYKENTNVIQYKNGASFLVLEDPESAQEVSWQDNIIQGNSWMYGVEVLLQRKFGKFSGWIGYTLSWNQMQFDSLNFGKKFFAKYDRRHDASVVGIYKPHERLTLSFTWVYGTGNRYTVPVGQYPQAVGGFIERYFDPNIRHYVERNNFRGEAYHRLDLGAQFHKKKERGIRTWEVSLYNAYGRANPFFYRVDWSDNDNRPKLMRIALFPLIPSVAYKWAF